MSLCGIAGRCHDNRVADPRRKTLHTDESIIIHTYGYAMSRKPDSLIYYGSRRIHRMIFCARCGSRYPADARIWRCSCRVELEYRSQGKDGIPPPESLALRAHSIWRYREAYRTWRIRRIVTLVKDLRPIITCHCHWFPVWFKLDFLCPTGSYKDRGSSGNDLAPEANWA